jgi:hypothetical protein
MFTNLSHQLLVLFSNKFSVPKTFLISSLFENDNNVFTTYHKKIILARKIQKAYRRYRLCKYRTTCGRIIIFARFWNFIDGCGGLRYSN